MVNVLQVISELGDGGVESMLIDLYSNIDNKNIKFIFVVHSNSRRKADIIKKNGGEIVEIKTLKEIGIVKYIKEIRKIIKLYKVDVVHCHNFTQNSIILFAASLSKVKIRVSHSHLTSCFSTKAKIFMPIIRLFINLFSTHRLACGFDAGKFLYGNKSFVVVNNAIDLDKFYKKDKSQVTINDIDSIINNKFVITHIGRLSIQKNHKFLFNIVNEYIKQDKDVVLLCCGSGDLENELSKYLKDNKLDKYIYLLGTRDDIPLILNKSDILLLPSLFEGLPITLIESQACGLKAIVSDKVDKNSDLGIGLIDFLPIEKESINKWCELIKYYKENGYNNNYDLNKVLTEKGYNIKYNLEKITSIYLCNE